jgi:molybdopterin-binding protein
LAQVVERIAAGSHASTVVLDSPTGVELASPVSTPFWS